jgi:hypothetical protein
MNFEEFLVKAKVATYASEGEANEKRLEDGAKELSFENGEYFYRDRYYGSNKFIGEEVVWKEGKVYWLMNYYGRIFENNNSKETYNFLKKAMRKVTKERPFRGPSELIEENWKYFDKSEGTIENFNGKEEIYFKGKKVYELIYHGGLLK